jgi:CheY-like chemotaxis protein
MSAPGQVLTGRRVLIGEDEYLIARDIQRLLVDAGCAEVTIVPSIAECARVRAEKQLDAAVLDLRLNDGDVCELAQEMYEGGLPLVFVTGFEQTAVPPALAHLPILAKPFPRRQLLNALDRVLTGGGTGPAR